jgi:medium-chain acyl-[acyl-carrier-protein] hydrolase
VFFEEINTMAEITARFLEEHRPSLPFAFFGHSLGALIAFETARVMRRLKLPVPIHLFVSGCMAPVAFDTNTKRSELPDDIFLKTLAGFRGIPAEVLSSVEYMDILVPALRADFRFLETYQYSKDDPLDCPISALIGNDDTYLTVSQVAMWEAETHGVFRIHEFVGSHFYFDPDPTCLFDVVEQELVCKQVCQAGDRAGNNVREIDGRGMDGHC